MKCLHVCTCSHFLLFPSLVWKQNTIKLWLSGLAHRNALSASYLLCFLSSPLPPPPPLSSVISEGSTRSAPLLGMTYRPEVLCAHAPVSRGERSIGRQHSVVALHRSDSWFIFSEWLYKGKLCSYLMLLLWLCFWKLDYFEDIDDYLTVSCRNTQQEMEPINPHMLHPIVQNFFSWINLHMKQERGLGIFGSFYNLHILFEWDNDHSQYRKKNRS